MRTLLLLFAGPDVPVPGVVVVPRGVVVAVLRASGTDSVLPVVYPVPVPGLVLAVGGLPGLAARAFVPGLAWGVRGGVQFLAG